MNQLVNQSLKIAVPGSISSSINNDYPSAYALISVHGDPTAELGKEGAGGQNVYVRELGLSLAERGCLVDLFTRREHPDQPEIEELVPGCRTIRLTAGPTRFIPREELFDLLPAFVQSWLDFQQRSQRTYKLLHTNYWLSGWVGLQLKKRLNLPQVHTYHSIGAVKYRNWDRPPAIAVIRRSVECSCLEQVDYVIATSAQEVEDLRQLVSQQGRIKIIPCSVSMKHFGCISQAQARRQLGIAEDSRLILYVGRFAPRKGIETLLHACSQLSQPFQLYLVGGSRPDAADALEHQRLGALVQELDLEAVTVFTGRVPRHQLPAYYAAANVCVVPSEYEPFGLVAIEAMATGTPVIASDVGGLRHTVVPQRTGLLVPPRDPAALATAIAVILENKELQQSYGKAGRSWVQSRFSNAAVAAQIHELYQSLTFTDGLEEAIQACQITPTLERHLQQLLQSQRLKATQSLALEQLLDALSNGVV